MKTLKILLTIEVPDEVTSNMIDISAYQDGYIIYAHDINNEIIDINQSDQGNIEYCTDTAIPTEIFLLWGIGDLESKALGLEGYEDDDFVEQYIEEEDAFSKPKPIYDRSKFSKVLRQIEHDHDADFGITWQTLEGYLENYCRPDIAETTIAE